MQYAFSMNDWLIDILIDYLIDWLNQSFNHFDTRYNLALTIGRGDKERKLEYLLLFLFILISLLIW